MLISALLAVVRGFTREVLSIVAWVAAAAAAWFLHPLAPAVLASTTSPSDTVALAAAIGGVFIVTLIVVSIITVKISDLILDSRIGALDRTLGFVFGAARGLPALRDRLGVPGLARAGQDARNGPRTRKTRPMLENTGNALIAMLPGQPGRPAASSSRQPRPEAEPAEPPTDADPPRRAGAAAPQLSRAHDPAPMAAGATQAS